MAVSFTRENDPFDRIHKLILSFEKSREKFRIQEKWWIGADIKLAPFKKRFRFVWEFSEVK